MLDRPGQAPREPLFAPWWLIGSGTAKPCSRVGAHRPLVLAGTVVVWIWRREGVNASVMEVFMSEGRSLHWTGICSTVQPPPWMISLSHGWLARLALKVYARASAPPLCAGMGGPRSGGTLEQRQLRHGHSLGDGASASIWLIRESSGSVRCRPMVGTF